MNIKIVTMQEAANLSYAELLQYRYKLADLVEKNRTEVDNLLLFSRKRRALLQEKVYLNQNLKTIEHAIEQREVAYIRDVPMPVLLSKMGICYEVKGSAHCIKA